MKRRSNKSHKVPNVKLRPPQAGTSRIREEDEQEHDGFWGGHAGSDDTEVLETCPRPFRKFVICATGITDKPSLFKKAVELGATVVGGFTDKVTHLVAEHHGGAKYECAMKRQVPIVLPSWINSCYDIWLRGDEFDVGSSVIGHTLPVFLDIVLCPSAITLTKRTEIHRLINEHGGQYVKEIERPVRVTHLLCAGEEETEKIKYAHKFNDRGEADIKLVWEEWFWDCLEFGGRFDEENYLVTRPRPERRVRIQPAPPSPPPLTERATSPPSSHAGGDDDEEDELAAVKRVPAVTLQLWQGLLKHRGYGINGAGKLCPSPTKTQRPPPPVMKEVEAPLEAITKQPSVISSFRRANSFAMEPPPVPSARAASTLFNRPEQPQASTSKLPPPRAPKLFHGLRFRILGEAKSASVKDAITSGDGVVDDSLDAEVDFIVIRLVSGSKFYRDEGDEAERSKYRTECWLERCIFEERICSVTDHLCFRPLGTEIPLQGVNELNVSFSGLDQSETLWMRRLLRALGIPQAPNFSRLSTHLFCPLSKGEKFERAAEWNIPVVGWSWFEEMTVTGAVPELENYALKPAKVDVKGKGKAAMVEAASEDPPEVSDEWEVPDLPKVDKGKGKAVDESTIQDITNNDISAFVTGRSSQKQKPPDEESIPFPLSSSGRPQGPPAIPTPKPLDQNPNPTPAPGTQLPPSTPPAVSAPTQQLFFSQASSTAPIPSSRTPSPMRVPPPGLQQDPSRLVQKINTLLGKRTTEDIEMGDDRAEKRLRPVAKQTSRPHFAVPDLEAFGKRSVNTSLDPSSDSMRIIYEDSEQAEEKRRLMNMLNIKEDTGPLKKHRRKSSRVAGF